MEQSSSAESTEPVCEFDSSRVEKLRLLFDHYDVDKNDMLDANELECMIVELGHDADHAMARALVAEFADASRTDCRGSLSFNAFLRLVAKLQREATLSRDESAPAQILIRRFSLSLASMVSDLSHGIPEEGAEEGSARRPSRVRETQN